MSHHKHENEHLERELECVKQLVLRILNILQPEQDRSAILTFVNENGEIMPLSVHLKDAPGQAVFTEFDGLNGTGNKVPSIGPVTFSSSNTATATVDTNTGALAYLAAGTATISGTDAGNSLTASDVLTVTSGTAISATLTLVAGPISPVTTIVNLGK
jgi:hypothetical protein